MKPPLIKAEMVGMFIVQHQVDLGRAEMVGLGQQPRSKQVDKPVHFLLHFFAELANGVMQTRRKLKRHTGIPAGDKGMANLFGGGKSVGDQSPGAQFKCRSLTKGGDPVTA